jgi:hypothetical protein
MSTPLDRLKAVFESGLKLATGIVLAAVALLEAGPSPDTRTSKVGLRATQLETVESMR